MLSRRHRSPKLFSDFNTLSFASVMGMVVLVPLLICMVQTTPTHGVNADLPRVSHPTPMPNANREDALKVVIMRDGKVYFGSDQVTVDSLRDKIGDRLKDHSVERKVYITADTRVLWSSVKPVLDGVRSAGILRVAFLVNQQRSSIAAPRP